MWDAKGCQAKEYKVPMVGGQEGQLAKLHSTQHGNDGAGVCASDCGFPAWFIPATSTALMDHAYIISVVCTSSFGLSHTTNGLCPSLEPLSYCDINPELVTQSQPIFHQGLLDFSHVAISNDVGTNRDSIELGPKNNR